MIEIVLGNMRAGKTTYAKAKPNFVFIPFDEVLSSFNGDFKKFYGYILSLTVRNPASNFILDGWFNIDNMNPQTILNLQKDSGHKVTITVFYVPMIVLMTRDIRNTRAEILRVNSYLIDFYKRALVSIPFSFRDQQGEISFGVFMNRIRTELVTATKREVEDFIQLLKQQEHYDRYYQTILLPYGLTLMGYERTEDTWNAIVRNVTFRGKTVLDVGCYHGYCCFNAEDAGAQEVTGLEKQERILEFTNKIRNLWKYESTFICADIDDYVIPKRYDIIFCLNMIQYTKHPEKVAEKICASGNLIILEATEEYKKIFDKVQSHQLMTNLDSPRTHDLHRRLYLYQRKNLLPSLQWFNIMQEPNTPLRMFFNTNPPRTVGIAESSDGYSFSVVAPNIFGIKPRKLLGNWEDTLLESHTVLKIDKRYRMYYGGYNGHWRIGIAESEDLLHWQRYHKNPILSLGKEPWENKQVSDPHVIQLDNSGPYLLYYVSKGNVWQTGLAFSNDGFTFHRFKGNPIIKADGRWNDGAAVLSGILQVGNSFIAAVHGYSLTDHKFRGYLYKSQNGRDNWKPVMFLGEDIIHPELHLVNGKWMLYYTSLERNLVVREIKF